MFVGLNACEALVAGAMGLWLCATLGANYRLFCNRGGADAGKRHEDGGFLWKANTAPKKKPRVDDEPNERVEILSLETCI